MAKKPKKKAAKKATKKTAKKAAKKTVKAKSSAKKATKAKRPAAKKAVAKPAPVVTTINPYLTFNGNCEEAFNFYKSVFGGKFDYIGRFKDMPPTDGKSVSPSEGEQIMHVSLPISKETVLMGSDSGGEYGQVAAGSNFSLSINAKSQKEADRLYDALSAGGQSTMPMSKTFWGSYFGMLSDKFGIQWMISFGQN